MSENPWTPVARYAEARAQEWMDRLFQPHADRAQADEWLERWFDCEEQAELARRAAAQWDA